MQRNVHEAVAEAARCLEIQAENRKCAVLKERAEKHINQIRAHHIKDVAVYKEGEGFIFYFSMVNSSDEYVAASGKVKIYLIIDHGALQRKALVYTSDVSRKDFVQGTLGRGIFSRESLIYKKWLSGSDFFTACSRHPNFDGSGNPEMSRLFIKSASEGSELFIQFEFTDADDRTVTGKADLNRFDL